MKTLILILLLLFAFTGCSIDENVDISITDENIIDVAIRDSNFNPDNIVINKGTTIKWTNYDSQGHTITVDGLFDSKTITKGKSFTYTFNDIGEYEYYCKIHSDMKGIVRVE